MENEQQLINDIDDAFEQFGKWVEMEKNKIYIRLEEIHKGDIVKHKQFYITKEEYQVLHQKKCSMIMDVFSKKFAFNV
jgi:hypothetical protein